jgi:hypothetical protein
MTSARLKVRPSQGKNDFRRTMGATPSSAQ